MSKFSKTVIDSLRARQSLLAGRKADETHVSRKEAHSIWGIETDEEDFAIVRKSEERAVDCRDDFDSLESLRTAAVSQGDTRLVGKRVAAVIKGEVVPVIVLQINDDMADVQTEANDIVPVSTDMLLGPVDDAEMTGDHNCQISDLLYALEADLENGLDGNVRTASDNAMRSVGKFVSRNRGDDRTSYEVVNVAIPNEHLGRTEAQVELKSADTGQSIFLSPEEFDTEFSLVPEAAARSLSNPGRMRSVRRPDEQLEHAQDMPGESVSDSLGLSDDFLQELPTGVYTGRPSDRDETRLMPTVVR